MMARDWFFNRPLDQMVINFYLILLVCVLYRIKNVKNLTNNPMSLINSL